MSSPALVASKRPHYVCFVCKKYVFVKERKRFLCTHAAFHTKCLVGKSDALASVRCEFPGCPANGDVFLTDGLIVAREPDADVQNRLKELEACGLAFVVRK